MANDLLLDNNNDLLITNGDLTIGPSEEQDVALILSSNPGEWKSSPLTGFGWIRRIKGEFTKEQLEKDLDTQLVLDGFINTDVKFDTEGKLQSIKATRKL